MTTISRTCAVGLMLLTSHAVDAQMPEVATGGSNEETETVEVEEDGSLDDTTGSVNIVTTERRLAVNVDVRTAYSDLESDTPQISATWLQGH